MKNLDYKNAKQVLKIIKNLYRDYKGFCQYTSFKHAIVHLRNTGSIYFFQIATKKNRIERYIDCKIENDLCQVLYIENSNVINKLTYKIFN